MERNGNDDRRAYLELKIRDYGEKFRYVLGLSVLKKRDDTLYEDVSITLTESCAATFKELDELDRERGQI